MTELLTKFAVSCSSGGFFGFPSWYKYLDGMEDGAGKCVPKINGINDVWLIVAAVLDMLLRVAALAAIGLIIYGGVLFITSQGEPEKTGKARSTIINAIVGLVISVSAAAAISFIAGRIN